jgi:iron complex transport system ATP-binding protein
MTALRCEGLTLKLSGVTVLDGVAASFKAGQWTAIVGPNGAGKSSWLQLLAGLRAPAAGQVWLQSRAIADWPARERAQQLAWLSQQGEAEGDIAARDVVRLGRLPRHGLLGAPDAADEAAVDAALAETECSALAQRRLSALSGGERQRVLLARVLAVGAPVLLLDEPTTHLDAPHQRALCRSLRARARAGAAVVSVMHDLTLALGADRIVVMHQGRITADGPPHDATLQSALAEVFEHAFSIQAVAAGTDRRWVAVPTP